MSRLERRAAERLAEHAFDHHRRACGIRDRRGQDRLEGQELRLGHLDASDADVVEDADAGTRLLSALQGAAAEVAKSIVGAAQGQGESDS